MEQVVSMRLNNVGNVVIFGSPWCLTRELPLGRYVRMFMKPKLFLPHGDLSVIFSRVYF